MKKLLAIIILNISLTQVINTTQGISYNSISEAIEEVNDYDIIEVGPQIYYERVTIWNPLTLIGTDSILDCSGYTQGIIIASNEVNISGFEIIGDEDTVVGIEVTGGCDDVIISNNIIHGMSLSNPANESTLSYGILAYGSESTPNPPNNLLISNNEIYETAGSGISLGSYTTNTTIDNNFIHDINPIEYEDDYISIGIIGAYSDQVIIENNIITNVSIGTAFSLSNGIIENNSYNDTPIFFLSNFYITDEDDGFDFITSENYFRATSSLFPPLLYTHSYCASLSMAMTLADDGSVILTSDGEEIIQDCNGEWGGASLEVCGSCDYILGDINNDNFLDVLDVVNIINYIVGNVEFDEAMLCIADLNQSEGINILDIVILVNQIIP